MDYSKMLEYTVEKDSDLTVSVMEVEWEEASRFGITNVDEKMKIVEFEEKPENPKNNMASMGIYIFKWEILRDALLRDAEMEHSDRDFGKNIIPMLLKENRNIFAYLFEGYWRDVGTIESYYKANMDLLCDSEEFDLSSKDMRVYSNNRNSQPHYVGECSSINNSLICDGCIIEGQVTNSIISYDVVIGKNSIVRDSIIFNNAVIEDGAIVEKAIIGENIRIEKNCRAGNISSEEITVIA
jgi:glucose-1-phosphate adenylyltransferase